MTSHVIFILLFLTPLLYGDDHTCGRYTLPDFDAFVLCKAEDGATWLPNKHHVLLVEALLPSAIPHTIWAKVPNISSTLSSYKRQYRPVVRDGFHFLDITFIYPSHELVTKGYWLKGWYMSFDDSPEHVFYLSYNVERRMFCDTKAKFLESIKK